MPSLTVGRHLAQRSCLPRDLSRRGSDLDRLITIAGDAAAGGTFGAADTVAVTRIIGLAMLVSLTCFAAVAKTTASRFVLPAGFVWLASSPLRESSSVMSFQHLRSLEHSNKPRHLPPAPPQCVDSSPVLRLHWARLCSQS